MAAADAAYTAVVTGASGFVATEIVAQLLAKAYTVRATVRSTKNTEKVEHLKALGEALPGRLTLHEADLLEDGSFDSIVKDAHFVFHTASPYKLGVQNFEEELIKPALQGTNNIISSVAKNKHTVRRVVLTSSFVAVVKPEKGPTNGEVFTEEDWNDEAQPDVATGYHLSKILAEKAAWDMCKDNGIDLVVINPTAIFGPAVSARQDGSSVAMMKALIEGTSHTLYPWQCDLADVARAHVLAAEVPTAKGRYIVSQDHIVSDKEVLKVLAQRFPQFKFSDKAESQEQKRFLDNSKVQKELGMTITPWQTSVIDMAVSLISKAVATPVLAH